MIELTPTHPEVLKAVKTLEDAMKETGLFCLATQDDENPNLWSVQCAEKAAENPDEFIIHTCFIGWNSVAKTVVFQGYDSGRTARNQKEGITGDEGVETLDLKSIDMAALWLTGDFHRILKSAQEKLAAMAEKAEKVAPKLAEFITRTEGHQPTDEPIHRIYVGPEKFKP